MALNGAAFLVSQIPSIHSAFIILFLNFWWNNEFFEVSQRSIVIQVAVPLRSVPQHRWSLIKSVSLHSRVQLVGSYSVDESLPQPLFTACITHEGLPESCKLCEPLEPCKFPMRFMSLFSKEDFSVWSQ